MRVQLSRAGLAVFLSPTRAKRLSVRPLRPAVLVAVELLGVAAEVAGEGLRGRHGYDATWIDGYSYSMYCDWVVWFGKSMNGVCRACWPGGAAADGW